MSQPSKPPAPPPACFTGSLTELMRLIGASTRLDYTRRVPDSQPWAHRRQIAGAPVYEGGEAPSPWIVVHLYASRRQAYRYIATYEQQCYCGIWLRISEDQVPEAARNYRQLSRQAHGNDLPDQWGYPTRTYSGAPLSDEERPDEHPDHTLP